MKEIKFIGRKIMEFIPFVITSAGMLVLSVVFTGIGLLFGSVIL